MPWGSWGDLPPDLALWAIGLGVAVHHNRPRRGQENGKVERGHGVLAAWAEPATCTAAAPLQTALTAASRIQRETSPACQCRSRMATFPALAAGGRSYDPAREDAAFDERRGWRYLAGQTWTRRVDKVGRISLYNRAGRVGRAWARQEVSVRFDPRAVAWVIRDATGATIRRHPAPELSRAGILALEVRHRR